MPNANLARLLDEVQAEQQLQAVDPMPCFRPGESQEILRHRHWDGKTLYKKLTEARDPEDFQAILHVLAVCPGCREVGGPLLDLVEMRLRPPATVEEA